MKKTKTDGGQFDARHITLKTIESSGQIRCLTLHPEVFSNGYPVDFRYFDLELKKWIVEHRKVKKVGRKAQRPLFHELPTNTILMEYF